MEASGDRFSEDIVEEMVDPIFHQYIIIWKKKPINFWKKYSGDW